MIHKVSGQPGRRVGQRPRPGAGWPGGAETKARAGAAPCGFQGAGFDVGLTELGRSELVPLFRFRNGPNYSTANLLDE